MSLPMSLGWTGNILRVDLTRMESWTEETEPYTALFIGGKGINVKILYDEVGPDVAPLDAEIDVLGVLAVNHDIELLGCAMR